jgi:hypothetical protein
MKILNDAMDAIELLMKIPSLKHGLVEIVKKLNMFAVPRSAL